MSDTKISQLPSGAPAQSSDAIPIARSGASYSLTVGDIAYYSRTRATLYSTPGTYTYTPSTGAVATRVIMVGGGGGGGGGLINTAYTGISGTLGGAGGGGAAYVDKTFRTSDLGSSVSFVVGAGGAGGAAATQTIAAQTVTSLTTANGTVTLNFAGPFTAALGSVIQVFGTAPTQYNGVYVVTGSTSTSVSYTNSTTTTPTTLGTVYFLFSNAGSAGTASSFGTYVLAGAGGGGARGLFSVVPNGGTAGTINSSGNSALATGGSVSNSLTATNYEGTGLNGGAGSATYGTSSNNNGNYFTGGCGGGGGGGGAVYGLYSGTASFTNGSAIVNSNYVLIINCGIQFTTTGTLPTNFSTGVTYYVISAPTGTTYTFSTTPGGTAIVAGSAGSGTHSVIAISFIGGNGSASYNSIYNGILTVPSGGFSYTGYSANGTDGTVPNGNPIGCGSGGGGGAVAGTTSSVYGAIAGNGGNAVNGGGGGGGASNTLAAGSGGKGGDGFVYIIEYF